MSNAKLLAELSEWDKLSRDPRLRQILRAQLLKLAFNDSSPSTAIKAIELLSTFEVDESQDYDLSQLTTEQILNVLAKANELILRSISDGQETG